MSSFATAKAPASGGADGCVGLVAATIPRTQSKGFCVRASFMIQVTNVVQHYGIRPVLKTISLEARNGELVVILGPNGSGKSTLLGVIGGMLEPQEGFV